VFSSPAVLMTSVWVAILIGIAAGPIEYPSEPSVVVLALVAAGVLLFVLACQAGAWCFRVRPGPQPNLPAPPLRLLNMATTASSMLGLAGIALIAFDRTVLSGTGSGVNAELLRCAPSLVDFIEVKRTPLLYLGYLTFSFGFASLVLFLLKGDEIRGWPAILAQLSILSPVGYAVLYSGRMPMLFIIILIVAAVLVRVGQGRRPLPVGHHLLLKMIVVLLLFGIYSSAMWSTRQAFCVQMSGLIRELQDRMRERDLARAPVPRSTPTTLQSPPEIERREQVADAAVKPHQNMQSSETGSKDQGPAEAGSKSGVPKPAPSTATHAAEPPNNIQSRPEPAPAPKSADSVSAADLSRMVQGRTIMPTAGQPVPSADAAVLLARMREAWHVTPRGYVLSAIESGRLSPGTATSVLSSYFYLTHGIRMLDLVWQARTQFTPHWGLYEVGVLSPIFRVFFPQSRQLASMNEQVESAEIYGFFPTAWGAAYIDFGAAGTVLYILIWGFAGGWSAFGAKHSGLALPPLLQTFILASIMLSSVEGPLGIANSAMVLGSIIVVGVAIDFAGCGRLALGRRGVRPATRTP